ncbi:MAG: GNAT family N-acetyltransferase [Turicibacter sp.]|nr:GNAT family N-acetyltransferase [Turicibacter sp.]
MNNIRIDYLQEGEQAAYRQMLLKSYAEYESIFQDPAAWQDYLKAIAASVDNTDSEGILVAKYEGVMVGGLQLFTNSTKAYGVPTIGIDSTIVRLLGVHPQYRGLGIAKKLLAAGLEFAQKRKDPSLYLHSGEGMKEAINMYLSMGFVRDKSKEFMNGDILVKSFRYDLNESSEEKLQKGEDVA